MPNLREVRISDDDLKRLRFLGANMGAEIKAPGADYTTPPTYGYEHGNHGPIVAKPIYQDTWLTMLLGQLLARVNYLEYILHIDTRDAIDAIEGDRRQG